MSPWLYPSMTSTGKGGGEMSEWQPMDTAPRDRQVLLDMSYWYPGDTDITEVFVVGQWRDDPSGYVWDCGDECFLQAAVSGWIDIPKSTALKDQ